MRIRFQKFKTPFFDYLFVSKSEMEDILDGTGWHVTRYLDLNERLYVAIIEKD